MDILRHVEQYIHTPALKTNEIETKFQCNRRFFLLQIFILQQCTKCRIKDLKILNFFK